MSDDSDSDGWAVDKLILPSKSNAFQEQVREDDNVDGGWDVAIEEKEPQVDSGAILGEPMIIVDVTQLDKNVHSKFDRNSVNDTDAATAWRKKIEGSYEKYSKDTALLENGTVIPCGSSVWRDALVRLRGERKGHYFCPVFPKKSQN